jgi:hypothetical protein
MVNLTVPLGMALSMDGITCRPPRRLERDPEKPALGLDPRAETGFPKRSRSIKMLERKSIQSEAISL